MQGIKLGLYKLADLAYRIERIDYGSIGGRQDQYASVFGGFNFMEFHEDRAIITKMHISKSVICEIEERLVAVYLGMSRDSSLIMGEQFNKVSDNGEYLDELVKLSYKAKEKLVTGDVDSFISIVGESWELKKKLSSKISNPKIEAVFDYAMQSGAVAGKVSGAGGGGFAYFFSDLGRKNDLVSALSAGNDDYIRVFDIGFELDGVRSWRISE